MSTLGKILAVFNVLAIAGFLVLAGKDRGLQQQWTYSAFRHQLLIDGLPIDPADDTGRLPGQHVVDQLTPEMLKDVFAQAAGGELGGQPTRTLVEELDRVYGKCEANVRELPPGQQRIKLRQYLAVLARTQGERQELLALIDKDPDTALTELKRRFEHAKKPPTNQGSGREASRLETRMNIAQILVNIDPTPEWRSRALVVLGMETYSRALDQHAAHLYTIAREFKALLASDQAKFEAHRHSLVESAMQESEALLRAEKFLDTLKVEVKKRTDLVDSRKQEVEAAKGALAKATTDASAELNQLNAMQADLFRIQQRLGAAQERTRELELELQRLEPKR